MEQQGGIRQPMLGILATIIVFFLSFGIIVWFTADTFGTWTAFLAMTVIPIQIIISLVWAANYPPPAAKLDQPLKGMYLLLFILIIGAMVSAWSLKTVGGFQTPPTPYLLFFTILTVVCTLWCAIVWQCWPASAINPHPAFVGFGTLILAYILTYVVYVGFFDFSFLEGTPYYAPTIHPGGAFNAWDALSFAVTTVAVILAVVELDFWPLSVIAKKAPAAAKQPVWSLMGTVWVLLIAYVVRSVFVNGLGMDVVVYAVRVPICMIFGEFIMLLLMQTYPVQTAKQPGKGLTLVVLSIVLAVAMYYLCAWFCLLVTGGLTSGPPEYAHELWLANALLAVTFPVIVVYTGFFNFWPLSEPGPPKK